MPSPLRGTGPGTIDAVEAGETAPARERRDELLDVAWEVAARDGLAATTYRNLASEAGTSTSPFVRQFPTRPDLLAAIFDRSATGFDGAREEAVAGAGPAGAIIAEGSAVLAEGEAARDRCRISLDLSFVSLRDPALGRRVRNRERDRGVRWASLAEAGQARGEVREDRPAEELADQLGSLLDGLVFASLVYPARLPRRHVRRLWEDSAPRLLDPAVTPGPHQRLVVPDSSAPRPHAPQDPEATRRAQLLAVAFRVTARDGLDGLSFRALAGEAGTSTTPFTHAFGSRRRLLAEMVRATWVPDPEVERLAALITSPVDRFFAEWATELSDEPGQVDRDRVYYELHHRALTDPELAVLMREGDQFGFEASEALVDAGREQGAVRGDLPAADLVDSLYALVDGLALRRLLLDEKRPAGYRIALWEDGGRRMLAP